MAMAGDDRDRDRRDDRAADGRVTINVNNLSNALALAIQQAATSHSQDLLRHIIPLVLIGLVHISKYE